MCVVGISFGRSPKLPTPRASRGNSRPQSEEEGIFERSNSQVLFTFSERSQSIASPKVVSCVAEPTNRRGMLAFHPRYRAAKPPSIHRDLKASHDPE